MLIPIEQIEFKPREFTLQEQEDIKRMAESVREDGLLHPITVEDLGTSTAYNLIAGQKRILACKLAEKTNIDCLVLPPGLTEDEKKKLHLKENLIRFNLPWYEACVMEKELLDLRQKELGVAKPGRKSGFSLRDLAMELGRGLGTVSEDIALADAVMADPSLRKIEDKITAKRLILNKARRIEAEIEAGIPTQIPTEFEDVLLVGDAFDILSTFPSSIFDVCFTDPPWLEYRDNKLTKDDRTMIVFNQVFRVLKPESFLYVVCSTPDFFLYQQELPKLGFKVQQMPLLWVKQNIVSHGLRSWEYMRDYEPILLAVKGSPVLAQNTPPSSVYASPIVHNKSQIHPNEKPVDVPVHFLEHCSYENSLVLDPFGGSGSTAEACLRLGRRYVTIERNQEFAAQIKRRLDDFTQEQPNDNSR